MPRSAIAWLLLVLMCVLLAVSRSFAIEAATPLDAPASDTPQSFSVKNYVVEGKIPLVTNSLPTLLGKYTGTNVEMSQLAEAAAELQAECVRQGFSGVSVAIPHKRIANGIVPMYVFQGATPQIVISGQRFFSARERAEMAARAFEPDLPAGAGNAGTNGPRFAVNTYSITGNTLLRTETLKAVVLKHLGTNVGVNDIILAGNELQKEYRDRGFPTVAVTIPPQQITNGIVKMRVFEGRLSDIVVTHNHFFSSNNVMRAMPSLRTNLILNAPVFQAELNRANANQDRQIYPKIEPGPQENTTILNLDVKDRLPLHGKAEFNNESSPGTPDERINTSIVYNNLWQLEHSLGLQYSMSPQLYKNAETWNFYDLPMVVNYSTFYRLSLAAPESVSDVIETEPGSFGYSEASRKFVLPPSSGQPELTFYASRSAIDSGLLTSPINLGNSTNSGVVTTNSALPTFSAQSEQQDLTVNQNLGTRFTIPIRGTENFQSSFSAGLDFKTYDILSNKTNQFTLSYQIISNSTVVPVTGTSFSPVPLTHNNLKYLPLSLHYDGALRDSLGVTMFGMGISGNVWHTGSTRSVESITGSGKSSGYWFTANPSLSRDFNIHTNWILTLRADGQWANQPLISNEQFGGGGVTSVRGYHEGEVFGDSGWHISLEQKTPPYVIGRVSNNNPLTVRASIFTDYAETFLIDPLGRPSSTDLWGVGIGGVATVGAHWEARLMLSFPLLRAGIITPYEPFFNFALNAQF